MSTYNTVGSGDVGPNNLSKSKTLPVLEQLMKANEGHVEDNTQLTIVYDDGSTSPVT